MRYIRFVSPICAKERRELRILRGGITDDNVDNDDYRYRPYLFFFSANFADATLAPVPSAVARINVRYHRGEAKVVGGC